MRPLQVANKRKVYILLFVAALKMVTSQEKYEPRIIDLDSLDSVTEKKLTGSRLLQRDIHHTLVLAESDPSIQKQKSAGGLSSFGPFAFVIDEDKEHVYYFEKKPPTEEVPDNLRLEDVAIPSRPVSIEDVTEGVVKMVSEKFHRSYGRSEIEEEVKEKDLDSGIYQTLMEMFPFNKSLKRIEKKSGGIGKKPQQYNTHTDSWENYVLVRNMMANNLTDFRFAIKNPKEISANILMTEVDVTSSMVTYSVYFYSQTQDDCRIGYQNILGNRIKITNTQKDRENQKVWRIRSIFTAGMDLDDLKSKLPGVETKLYFDDKLIDDNALRNIRWEVNKKGLTRF